MSCSPLAHAALLAAVGAGLTSCNRPTGPTTSPLPRDAGWTAPALLNPVPDLPPSAPSGMDFRTALYFVLPEFRGIHILWGESGLERTLAEPWAAATTTLVARGFVMASPDAGPRVVAVRPPFVLKQPPNAKERTVRLVVPLDDDSPSRLLQTQSPLSSETLGALLPKAAPGTVDALVMELAYQASDTRAESLVRQLAQGHQASGWRLLPQVGWPSALPDGGTPPLPQRAAAILENPQLGSTLEVARQGDTVTLHYRQPLRPRPPPP